MHVPYSVPRRRYVLCIELYHGRAHTSVIVLSSSVLQGLVEETKKNSGLDEAKLGQQPGNRPAATGEASGNSCWKCFLQLHWISGLSLDPTFNRRQAAAVTVVGSQATSNMPVNSERSVAAMCASAPMCSHIRQCSCARLQAWSLVILSCAEQRPCPLLDCCQRP